MDDGYLLAAARYILLNPVRAGLTSTAEEWPHSSARARLGGSLDGLADLEPLSERVVDWSEFLDPARANAHLELFHRHQGTGRPLGSDSFVRRLERLTGRRLRPRKPGRKPSK